MTIELTDEQARALADWSNQQHIPGGLSGWGSFFTAAMEVADSVREQLETPEEENTVWVTFLVGWKDGTWTEVGVSVPMEPQSLSMFDDIMEWVDNPGGLSHEDAYKGASTFAVLGY